MDENAKTNEFKEMVKAALGELSNEEIEKLKKFMETSGDIAEHHGNGEELSDEQLKCVGGGNGTDDDYEKSLRDKILNIKQSEKQTDNLIADVTMEIVLGSVPSKEPKEDIKKITEEMISSQNDTIPRLTF